MSVEELAEAIAIDPQKDHLDVNERLMEPEEVLDFCGSLLRIETDRTVVLGHYSVKEYLLSDRLAAHCGGLAKFALRERSSMQHVSMCVLTYMFTVGQRIQELQDEYLDPREFPLFAYAKRIGISDKPDYETVGPWIERYFPLDSAKRAQLVTLIDYANPPAPYEGNYTEAWPIQRAIQDSLMCYWERLIDTKSSISCSAAKNKSILADLFVKLQHDWYVDHKSNVARLMLPKPFFRPFASFFTLRPIEYHIQALNLLRFAAKYN